MLPNRHILFAPLMAVLLLSGCASQPTQFPQCGRITFLHCLDVDAARCDAMLADAKSTCQKRLDDNTFYENMPENMKAGHLNRCMASDVVAASGKPEDDVKTCLRW